MKQLQVIYQGWGERWPLGTLADDGTRLLFEYSPQAQAQGLELSPLRLPLRGAAAGPYPSHQHGLPGLIYDALPDGWGLLLMDRLFRRAGRQPARLSQLDRLAFIGDRALGALSFEPAQVQDLLPQDLQLLTLAQQAQALIEGHDSEALPQLARLGGSPQGARPKVLVQYDPATGHISTQADAAGQPWLMKFQAAGEHKEACAIEALYADLARAAGLDMPDTRLIDLSPTLACFAIARFDRERGLRVPIHTLAALLHADFRLPSLDYTTFLRATRRLTLDEREVVKAYERAVFNVLFHNRDDHGKNFSYRLGADRRWRLAPAYDLTWNAGPGGEHHMDICGEGRAPARADLLRLAREGGVSAPAAQTSIERIAAVAQDFAARATHWPIRVATVQMLAQSVAANLRRIGA
jgi:serine/threonine-protein kinase HipA